MSNPSQNGQVLAMSPAANTPEPQGTSITLTVGQYNGTTTTGSTTTTTAP